MWDQNTGRSRGYGFVSFRNEQALHLCLHFVSGKWLGSRQIRCNWATKGANNNDAKQSSDAKSVVELTNVSSEDGKEATNNEAPENNPQFTTVYVGNLAPEVTQLDLHRHFHALGAGVIEEVRVQRDKNFGFVRYNTHAEAALAIQMGNTQSILRGRQIKCSWGNKPTPPGTASNPLSPPAPAPYQGLSAIDLLAYDRQVALAKMGGVHAFVQPQGQLPPKQASMGMGVAGASQAIYDAGFQNMAAAQQLMYYQ
nr:oligouridylate-binding protein 1B [Ipomoea batatas]